MSAATLTAPQNVLLSLGAPAIDVDGHMVALIAPVELNVFCLTIDGTPARVSVRDGAHIHVPGNEKKWPVKLKTSQKELVLFPSKDD